MSHVEYDVSMEDEMKIIPAKKSGYRAPSNWKCMECGRKMTLKTAERCAFGEGCPKCGGVDIDLIEGQR